MALLKETNSQYYNGQQTFQGDGIVDQFGGSKNKKFLTKRFLVLLTEIASLTIACQEEKIKAAFIDWKGDNDQIDDILVMGIRI